MCAANVIWRCLRCTPSARRATIKTDTSAIKTDVISIHALREEGDLNFEELQEKRNISIHALREEGDAMLTPISLYLFLISIHALREEGDAVYEFITPKETIFQSTPSARRATASRYAYRAGR